MNLLFPIERVSNDCLHGAEEDDRERRGVFDSVRHRLARCRRRSRNNLRDALPESKDIRQATAIRPWVGNQRLRSVGLTPDQSSPDHDWNHPDSCTCIIQFFQSSHAKALGRREQEADGDPGVAQHLGARRQDVGQDNVRERYWRIQWTEDYSAK